VVDEDWCIGCTKCLEACPTDAIVGIHKRMHTVIETHCTGCELCLPVCPVDCITMETATPGRTGWQAWSQAQADHALARYQRRSARLDAATAPEPAAHTTALSVPSQSPNSDPAEVAEARKRAMVQAAMARARAASNR
jgi:electron transport complex protein RnfB